MTIPPPPPPPLDGASAKAFAKANRPWYKKKRFAIPLGFVAVGIIGSAAGQSDSGDTEQAKDKETTSVSDSPAPDTTPIGDASENPKAAPTTATSEPEQIKVIKVEATALIKEFEQNEFAADQKYKGETLEITGRVNKIDTDLFDSDKYILKIGGGGDFEFFTVNCHDVSNDALSALTVGQKVTAIGEFDDGGDLGVEVTDCRIK